MKDPHVYQPKTPKKRFKPTRKQIKLAVVVLTAVIALTAGVLFLTIMLRNHNASKRIDDAVAAAQTAMEKGDYKKAQEALKPVENIAASNSDKATVYSLLAGIAMTQDRTADAVKYLEKKHAADPSTAKADALNLGMYYQRIGENDMAIEQLKIAVAYLESQPSSTGRNTDLSAVKARLEELGVK